jgi:pimeloyl-ACP methyl ester carboxylesterase
MPSIVRDGIKLAYEERGKGSPAFVFVHGWSCNRSFFAAQAEHFASGHRTVSVDLRGHGESDKPRGATSVAGFADDVAYVIRELGLGKVVAVGHSLGGGVALQLAAAHPEQVAAIVMVDPAPLVIPPEFTKAGEDIVNAIEAGNQEPRRQFIAHRLFQPNSDGKLVDRVLSVMMSAPDHVAIAAMKAVLAFDGAAAAARCKVPVLHLMATRPFNPPQVVPQWLPHVVEGLTVGTSHFSMMEVPDQVNAMIAAFVRHHV